MNDEATRFIRDQFWYLHAEYLARILIQNLILVLQLVLFIGVEVCIAAIPNSAPTLAIAFSLESLVAAVMWTHSGRRQIQIRTWLLEIAEPTLGNSRIGWYSFLSRRRIDSPLGAMWRIGTIGVFCSLPIFTVLLLESTSTHWSVIALSAGSVLATLALTTHPPVRPEAGSTA